MTPRARTLVGTVLIALKAVGQASSPEAEQPDLGQDIGQQIVDIDPRRRGMRGHVHGNRSRVQVWVVLGEVLPPRNEGRLAVEGEVAVARVVRGGVLREPGERGLGVRIRLVEPIRELEKGHSYGKIVVII